ncbi:MAG: hypothetical protein KC713_09165, partial [Candidatus Omnitrophica bacterium]|nr:hypothetical protein [Candidatus Omnitrophota bacterium]
SRRKVPILHINGRLSDPSFKMYKKFSWFFLRIIETVNVFAVQTEQDARKVISLGADSEKVKVIGNMKFDISDLDSVLHRRDLGFGQDDVIFVAGSTHPGEEEILLNMYKQIQPRYPDLKLILAPRHVERSRNILKKAEKYRLTVSLLSEIRKGPGPYQVCIVDTIGQLRALYTLADIVFVGKTLRVGGGQNMIEPASSAKPIIVGPLTGNFKGVMETLLRNNAIIEVKDEAQLCRVTEQLLSDKTYRNEIGGRAKTMVAQQRGSLDKTLHLIDQFISR